MVCTASIFPNFTVRRDGDIASSFRVNIRAQLGNNAYNGRNRYGCFFFIIYRIFFDDHANEARRIATTVSHNSPSSLNTTSLLIDARHDGTVDLLDSCQAIRFEAAHISCETAKRLTEKYFSASVMGQPNHRPRGSPVFLMQISSASDGAERFQLTLSLMIYSILALVEGNCSLGNKEKMKYNSDVEFNDP